MDENALSIEAANALQHIARNEEVKAYVMQNAPVREALFRVARRFVCGETLHEATEVAWEQQQGGHATSIDYMGESTRDEALAEEAVAEFLRVLEAVGKRRLNTSVSLDLSHVGLAIDSDLTVRNAARIAEAARVARTEVMISMEGTERTDDILDVHGRLCEGFDNVGVTLQAYLHRTEEDLKVTLERPGRIRLVKGAYEEPPSLAVDRKSTEVDDAYRARMQTLLQSGHACSVATHDPELLEHAHVFVQENGLDTEPVEFEMLYGVTSDRLQKMHGRGYGTRVYLVYGEEWYLYLCHRLAEYPPNVYQAVTDAVVVDGLERPNIGGNLL